VTTEKEEAVATGRVRTEREEAVRAAARVVVVRAVARVVAVTEAERAGRLR